MGMTVSELYQQVLGRTPLQGGLDYYTNIFGADVSAEELAAYRRDPAVISELAKQQAVRDSAAAGTLTLEQIATLPSNTNVQNLISPPVTTTAGTSTGSGGSAGTTNTVTTTAEGATNTTSTPSTVAALNAAATAYHTAANMQISDSNAKAQAVLQAGTALTAAIAANGGFTGADSTANPQLASSHWTSIGGPSGTFEAEMNQAWATHLSNQETAGFLNSAMSVLALIPGPHQPFVAAYNAMNAASQGNIISALASAAGAAGFNAAAGIGEALGATGATAQAVGNAIIAGTNAAATGQDIGKAALTGAAISGISSAAKTLIPTSLGGTNTGTTITDAQIESLANDYGLTNEQLNGALSAWQQGGTLTPTQSTWAQGVITTTAQGDPTHPASGSGNGTFTEVLGGAQAGTRISTSGNQTTVTRPDGTTEVLTSTVGADGRTTYTNSEGQPTNLYGGAVAAGVSTIVGGMGNDSITGGGGNSTITGGGGTSTITGGGGNDSTGGNWWDTLSTAFDTNPFGVLSSVLGLGSGLSGLFGGTSDAQQAADPFAPYRAGAATNLTNFQANPYSNAGWASTLPNVQGQQTTATPFTGGLASGDYIGQLNSLMSDPSSVTNTPGYSFLQQQGMQGVQRGLSARGQTVSGRELLALQEQDQGLANQQYLQQQALLSPLAQAQSTQAESVWKAQQEIALANSAATQRAGEFNATGRMGQYNTQLSTLAGIAGATNNPATAATLGANQNQANWQSIFQGLGGLGGASQPATTTTNTQAQTGLQSRPALTAAQQASADTYNTANFGEWAGNTWIPYQRAAWER